MSKYKDSLFTNISQPPIIYFDYSFIFKDIVSSSLFSPKYSFLNPFYKKENIEVLKHIWEEYNIQLCLMFPCSFEEENIKALARLLEKNEVAFNNIYKYDDSRCNLSNELKNRAYAILIGNVSNFSSFSQKYPKIYCENNIEDLVSMLDYLTCKN